MGLSISTANSSLYFSIDWPTDDDGSRRDDIVGAKIWMSQTDGFTPGAGSLTHDGPDLSAVVPGLEPGAIYYVRYAIVSGIDLGDVAISDQITAPAVTDADPATLFRIVSEDAVVSQSSDGSFSPAVITFSAEQVTGNGLPEPYLGRFRITLNGTNVTEYLSSIDESSIEFTIPTGTTKVWCALFESGGTTTRLDAVTIPVLVDGAWAMSIVVTNPAHAVPCSSTGSPLSYVGSGTDIRVYVGDTELVYDGAGAAKGTWTVTASGTGITAGSVSDSGDYATVGAHSGMTTDTASVSYTITGKRAGGAAFSRTVKQSLTKAKAGATGATGAAGSTGPVGATGQRGAGNFYAVAASAAWSDSVADARVLAVTGSSTRIVGDSVTQTYSSSWTMTKYWDGVAWVTQGTVIDGSLLVSGSVRAASIDTTALTIKNASGVTKVSADATGNLQLSGDIVLDGGDIYGKAGKFSALHGSSNQGSASCYCYASDYTYNSQYHGVTALRSAWADASGEPIGNSASWLVYSAISTGSDYYGVPYASTIRGVINGTQAVVIKQNETELRGMVRCSRTVTTGTLTDAPMWLSATYGCLVLDSAANKCLSWNDGASTALRSGHRAAGGVESVTVAGDGAAKVILNTDAQNGSVIISASPIVASAGSTPTWAHNITISSTAGVTIDGWTAWHSGNDGSGSGLDADKLDGMEPATTSAASTIVARDAAGNFAAGTITATFSGNGSGVTSLNASSLSSGSVPIALIPTGTTSSTVALGDHTHSDYALASHTQAWSTITSAPTTIAGYGITDAAASTHTHSDYALASHTQAWSTITSTPTTRAGYGITDAAASTHTHSDYATKSVGNTFSGGQTINGTVTTQYLRPDADNTRPLGGSSYRWSQLFAATSTINTSDAREKTDVVGLSESEIAAAVELSKRVGMFQFLDAVAAKRGNSRWHIGMTVQSVADVLVAHGLDPWRYGFMCYDSWDADDEHGSGDRYAFRTEELLLFIAAGINERLARLENGS